MYHKRSSIADVEWRRNVPFMECRKITMFGSPGNPYPIKSRIHLNVNSFICFTFSNVNLEDLHFENIQNLE